MLAINWSESGETMQGRERIQDTNLLGIIRFEKRFFIKRVARCVFTLVLILSAACKPVLAQDLTNYLWQLGTPSAATTQPVELGYVNLGNGNLHLEIPLGTFPQKGNSAPLSFALVYDSRIWWNSGSGSVWTPRNFSTLQDSRNWLGAARWGGWRLVASTAGSLQIAQSIDTLECLPQVYDSSGNVITGYYTQLYNGFYFMSPDGTLHIGPFTTQTTNGCPTIQGVQTHPISPDQPSASSRSSFDSAGFLFNVNGSNATVVGPDGLIVYPRPTDTNGNAYSGGIDSDFTDTVGRVPLATTFNCNGNVNQICYDVLNSQGGKSRYTITLQSHVASTSFGQSDVTECTTGCSVVAVSSIGLPDGTSYGFTYDSNYVLLQSVQLPTGGTANFAYTTFEDLAGERNRWLSSYAPSTGGSWQFVPQLVQPCAAGSNTCQQQLTRTSPEGDDTVFQFLINKGAWKSLESDYSGNSVSGGTLLKQEVSQFNFNESNPSRFYVNNTQTTTTIPLGPGGGLVKQVQYNYDTQNPDFGALLSLKEWNYHPSQGEMPVVPDRATYYTYQYQQSGGQSYATANILRATASITACNNSGSDSACGGAGSAVAKTTMSYDTTSPSGIHGNLSQVQKWVGGSSWLTTGITYDSFGNTTQVTDPQSNSVQMSYADRYFSDSSNPPSNPPASFTPSGSTNAYATGIMLPIIGTSTYGYYYNTGKLAVSTDPNGATSYEHYLDPFDRITHVYTPPILTPSGSNSGWSLVNYSLPTQTDAYTGITSTLAATNCSGCRHDQSLRDPIGRPFTSILASDPEGQDHVDTLYDSDGRVSSITNPYRSATDPTYGADSFAYDGLNRIVKTTHSADGSSSKVLYGPAATAIGLAAPLCPISTCGIGYPSVAIDETGRLRQSWTDAFGRIIEVDTPGAGSSTATSATAGTGQLSLSGSEQSFNNGTSSSVTINISASLTSSDTGTVSITVNGVTDSVSYPVSTALLAQAGITWCSSNNTACAIANALAYAVNADAASPVGAANPFSSNGLGCGPNFSPCSIILGSKLVGANTNFAFSTNVTHTAGSGSISATPSTGNMTGGTDNWIYDTGTLTVSINGQTLSPSVSYGQTSTSSSLASSLASAINGSSNLGNLVMASATGAVVNLVAKATGAPSNYTLSATSSTTSANPPHAFFGPSFDITSSWGDLTGGENAGTGGTSVAASGSVTITGVLQTTGVGSAPNTVTFSMSGSEQSMTPSGSTTPVYDQGFVSIMVNPCQGSTCAAQSPPSQQPGFQVFVASAAFGQGTSTANIVQDLACVLNNSVDSPVTASVSGTSITLTAKSVSASLASYNYQIIPNTFFDYTHFNQPSFAVANSMTLTAGQSFTINISPNPAASPGSSPKGDLAWVTVNGVSAAVVDTSQNASTLATNWANAINSSISSVTATASGPTVQISAKTNGSYSLASFIQPDLGFPFIADFVMTVTPPPPDDVNRTATVTNDSGTVSVTVNNVPASVSYGTGSTAESVAAALASAINGNNSYPVTAWVQDSTVNLTARVQGSSSDYSLLAASSTGQPSVFSSPSFAASASGSTLTGGVDAGGLSLTASSSSSTFYQYDTLGNLLNVTQGGQSRTYTYDALSRVTAYCTPETGPSGSSCGTTNVYYTNATGGLCAGDPTVPCRITDPLGVTTTFQYDQLSRLTSKSYSDGTTSTVTYCYDGQNTACLSGFTSANGVGRRTAMKDGSGATGWSYDPDGNVVTKQRTTNAVTQTFTYTHNLDGSVATITYPSNRTITYSYSNAQRTTSAADVVNNINYATGARYAAIGALSNVVHGSANGGFQGITESYSYNHRMQLAGIFVDSSAGTVLDLAYNLSQGSGNNGDVASISNNIDNTRTQTFTYDPLSRLATAQSQATSGGNCWGLSFGVDPLANLNSETVTKCSANPLSVSVSAKNQITGLAYDLDGRLTNDGTNTYAYDAEDRVTSVAGVTYSYDGNGLRVMKSNGTIDWRGTGGNTLVETNLTGGLQSEYIFFNGARIARRDSSGNVYYFFTDHLSSTRAVTNATGAVCYQADFTPYGGELTPSGFTNSCTPNYRFTGFEYDSETQNNYALARYYNSHLGRFLSTDPVDGDAEDSQSWNKYAYVGNNPANLADPVGMDDDPVLSMFGCGIDCFFDGGGFMTSPGLASQFDMQQQFNNDWSLIWQLNASANFLGQELLGVWDATGGALISAAAHPINTLMGIGQLEAAINDPYSHMNTWMGLGQAGKEWFSNLLSGNPRSIGQLAGVVLTSVGTGGAGLGTKAASAGESIQVASGMGGGIARMTVVRTISRGEKVADIIAKAKELAWTTGNEHALVKLASGERALVAGGPGGIEFAEGEITRIFGHTHPYGRGTFGLPSVEDVSALGKLGQVTSYILDNGILRKFSVF